MDGPLEGARRAETVEYITCYTSPDAEEDAKEGRPIDIWVREKADRSALSAVRRRESPGKGVSFRKKGQA
jgi:hypothetical protein